MNLPKKTTLYRLAPYAVLFLTVTAILFTVYAIQGIFPFGDGSITYADFAQSYVPQFYHYWDMLHGLKNPFFDWYSGTGVSMVSTDMLSPFNLFFLFIPRESVFDSMSFFFALKVIVSAITCYIFINKVFSKIDIGYKLGFSVLYSMSGYVLQYYSNVKWLDIVAVFPLLMLGFYYIMKKEKILLYAISLAIIMLENFYVSVQVIIFLLFTSGLYIILMVNKNEKKYKAFSLALGTVVGIGLTAFKTLPTFLTLMGSSRGEGNANRNYFKIIDVTFKDKLTTNDMNKWFMLMGLELAVVLCVLLIARFVKHKRATAFFVSEALILFLPVFFEGTNRLWHTGSYVGFPMRSGFTIAFTFIVGACYCVNFEAEYKLNKRLPARGNSKDKDKLTQEKAVADNSKKELLITIGFGAAAVVLVCLCVPMLIEAGKTIKNYGSYFLNTKDFIIPKLYLQSAALLIAAAVLIVLMKKSWVKSVCIMLAVLVPLSVSANSFIGVKKYVFPEQNPQFIRDAEIVNSSMPKTDSVLDRVKNADNSLSSNYPFIIRQGSLSNWTHNVSGDAISAMKSMGYSTSYTRLIDTGGTLLSDAVMGIKNIVAKQKIDLPVYTLTKSENGFNYYSCKYTLPTGLVASDDIVKMKTTTAEISKTTNSLYHSISNDPENIMGILSTAPTLGCYFDKPVSGQAVKYNVHITGKKMIYFKSYKKNLTITVNGANVTVPTYLSEDKTTYPSGFNNNVIPLAYAENESVSVEVSGSGIDSGDVTLYAFDVDKLDSLCQKYNSANSYSASTGSSSMSATVNADGSNQVFFVPTVFDKGWSATVNGKPVEIQGAVNGGFMAVPLEKGSNEIKLTYFPNGMKAGIVITLVIIAMLVLVLYLNKKKNITRPPQAAAVVVKYLLYIIWTAAVIAIYVVPIIYELFIATGKPA